jgi:hypothetical protein
MARWTSGDKRAAATEPPIYRPKAASKRAIEGILLAWSANDLGVTCVEIGN